MKIAIVEDDMKIREELSKLLKNNGYEVISFNEFESIPLQIKNSEANLVLLDINLPFKNGYEICRKIKEDRNIPIIFVTSRDSTEDEIMSIKVGGIDFITKPYDTIILLEKIKRAINLTDPKNFKEMTKKGYTLDLHLSLLKYKDQEVELTRNEFRILYYFFMNDNRVISKEELLEKLWNDKYYLDENILLVNINRLRKKAEEIGIKDLLENVRGKGYKL